MRVKYLTKITNFEKIGWLQRCFINYGFAQHTLRSIDMFYFNDFFFQGKSGLGKFQGGIWVGENWFFPFFVKFNELHNINKS